jgi:hypothetical protein
MAKPNRRPGGATPPGQQAPAGRPSLVPAVSLPGWKAAVQAFLLLGIPLALLFAAKLVLKRFFPELGY